MTSPRIGVDEPDADFYEDYACGSPRNYACCCDELVMKRLELARGPSQLTALVAATTGRRASA